MANIFTESVSPDFTKQSLTEFFVDPMFIGEDIRGAITVRTDIKGTEKLNKISRPSMITKPKVSAGFTPTGSFILSTKDITVKPMAIEFEQNAREFWGTVLQELLAQGYKEDDVDSMSNPDVWNKILLPIIAQAGQKDLIRQMWFADPLQQTLDSSYVPTGVVNDNYTGYTGFFSNFIEALRLGSIPSAQNISVSLASAGTKMKATRTLTIANGTITVTINGTDYTTTYTSSATATLAAWVTAHKATIEALYGTHAVVVSSSGAVLTVESKFAGAKFLLAVAASTGSWADTSDTAAVLPGSLSTDAADTTLGNMVGAMPPEMLELDPVFSMSRAMYRNLFNTWKAIGTETGNKIRFRGLDTPCYEGIPILIRPDWDIWDKALGNVFPNRVLLTPQKNLLFATDGLSDSEMIETWYNQDEQMRRYRVQYKAQTAYLHNELVVVAGMPSY